MRTTLTLDEDVARRLRQELRRSGRSLKALVNDGLRLGLRGASRSSRVPRFTVKACDLGLKRGLDPDQLNQLVDALQVAEALRQYRP